MLAWHRQQGRLGRALMTWIHHCNVLPGGNILKIGCGRRKPPTCGNTFPRFLHFDSEVLVSDPAPSMRCRQKCRREKKTFDHCLRDSGNDQAIFTHPSIFPSRVILSGISHLPKFEFACVPRVCLSNHAVCTPVFVHQSDSKATLT